MNIYWIITFLSLTASIASARLGETVEEIEEKYTKVPMTYDFNRPVRSQTGYFVTDYMNYKQSLTGKLNNLSGYNALEVRAYKLETWAIGVVFLNGKSVMEAFMKHFPAIIETETVDASDAARILEANSNSEAEWTEIPNNQAAKFIKFEKGWIFKPNTPDQIEAFQAEFYFVVVSNKLWEFMQESAIRDKNARDNALEKL